MPSGGSPKNPPTKESADSYLSGFIQIVNDPEESSASMLVAVCPYALSTDDIWKRLFLLCVIADRSNFILSDGHSEITLNDTSACVHAIRRYKKASAMAIEIFGVAGAP